MIDFLQTSVLGIGTCFIASDVFVVVVIIFLLIFAAF